MTPAGDAGGDALGLAETFPRPGWVVIDAIRDSQFTGEVVFRTTPEARVYADRGRVYLAERVTDPPLGARLVDAGAIDPAQLATGAINVGGVEHLGRLFDRAPSVDRHTVLVTAELMTDECIGWLAGQRVSGAVTRPYRHHPSGVHRWDADDRGAGLTPGDPLPAPAADAAPVDLRPPRTASPEPDEIDTDDVITWNEPSSLGQRLEPIDIVGRLAALRGGEPGAPVAGAARSEDGGPAPVEPDAVTADSSPTAGAVDGLSEDWIDHLGTDGLPLAGSDPLASPVRLTPLPTEPIDRFELIWPSGDVDEQFGEQADEPFPHPDIDRAGPTARLVRDGVARPPADAVADPPEIDPPEAPVERADPAVDELDNWLEDGSDRDTVTDEVVLAVRRAVASIDTGSLASRRRLVDTSTFDPPTKLTAGHARLVLPGRVAVRNETVEATWPGMRGGAIAGASVFDNLPAVEPALVTGEIHVNGHHGQAPDGEPHRASALRRLIGSIRRR